ncbi:MAG: RNA polymerase sigma factor [Candidatus Kapaibacterium sp.]
MADTINKHTTDPEQEILQRFKDGDKEAFVELFQRHHTAIYRYCHLMLGEKEAAEDIYQDTFYKFYTDCREGKDVHSVRGFLTVVARSRCLDYLKRKKRHTSFNEVAEPSWEPDLASADTQFHLREALSKIPHQYREAFTLHVLREYSYEEIAEILGIGPHVVKNRIYRAKQNLRKVLSPIFREDGK